MVSTAKEKRPWYGSWWALVLYIFVGLIILGTLASNEEQTLEQESLQPKEIPIVSNSFDDFVILCDRDATDLQKQDLFNRQFKNNYVEWTGEISRISDKNRVQVKHCPSTFTSDILVQMRDDQREKLLTFREGNLITYRAKLTRLGDILGLSATDGEVIEGAQTPSSAEPQTQGNIKDITGKVVKETIQETEPSCSDECTSDSCDGLNFVSCQIKGDGCRHIFDEGKVKGKCGVQCIKNNDCVIGYECNLNICNKRVEKAQKAKEADVIESSGILDALEELQESLEQQQNVNSKIDECTILCAGEDYDIPVVRDAFYQSCYQIYYYAGENELDKEIAKCAG